MAQQPWGILSQYSAIQCSMLCIVLDVHRASREDGLPNCIDKLVAIIDKLVPIIDKIVPIIVQSHPVTEILHSSLYGELEFG